MANVITKLQLETTQFDSKLRDSAKSLAEVGKQAQKSGKSFTDFDKAAIENARSLGQVASGATNLKDKVKDLVGAYNAAANAYNNLSREQQQSDFGKALANSISQLKTRIGEAKQELYGLGDAMKSAGGGGLFGGDNLKGMLQVFGGNLMTKGAAMVASFANEMGEAVKQGIELARQGEGIRNAFERLGRGDIMQGLREATHGTVTDIELMKAAVKFNDFKLPLDELGTMLAFAQQKAKDTGQSVDYMVDSIVTGLGRKSLMILDNLGLSASQVKEKMKETGDMTKAVGAIIREEMAKAGDYVETAADRATKANVNLQNKMEELGRKFLPLQEASDNLWTSMKIGILDIIGGPLTNLLNKLTEAGRLANQYGVLGGNAKVGRMTQELSNARTGIRQSLYSQQVSAFWDYINPREQQIKDIRAWQSGRRGEALQGRVAAITEKYGSLDATKIQAEVDAAKKMLSEYQAAAKQILQPIEQKIVPTVTTTTGGKGGRSNKDIAADIQKQFDMAMLKSTSIAEKAPDMKGPSEAFKAYTDAVKQSSDEAGNSVKSLADAFKYLNNVEGVQVGNGGKVNESVKAVGKSAAITASIVSTIGTAFNAIEDPAAKVAGTIAMSIAQIALAYAQALAADPTLKTSVYGLIAGAAAAMVSMVTTIGTVKSSARYAEGGIVQGNTYSNDQIPASLNAGEVVLNAAQSGNLASRLQDGDGGGRQRPSYITGEQIWIAMNRYTRRTGQGEVVTWR